VKVVTEYTEGLENSIVAVELCRTNVDGVMTAKFDSLSSATNTQHPANSY